MPDMADSTSQHTIPYCRGDRASYVRGCRCGAAKADAARYAREYRAKAETAGYIMYSRIERSIAYQIFG
jgi:hypothetical protein